MEVELDFWMTKWMKKNGSGTRFLDDQMDECLLL
jgi:hypothetical protein